MDDLRMVFPTTSADLLRAALEVAEGDANAATIFLLSSGAADLEHSMRAAQSAAEGESAGGGEGDDEALGEIFAEGNDDEADDQDGEEEDGEEFGDDADDDGEADAFGAADAFRETKRLRTVEPTPPEELADRKTNLVQFDETLLRKTYLELLNLNLSKLVHTTVTLWSDAVADQRAATAALDAPNLGWWIQHYPVAEVDHVWRVIVNSHCSKESAHARPDPHARATPRRSPRVVVSAACTR